jgi:tRNA G26 N,N-dimethylase Trm1
MTSSSGNVDVDETFSIREGMAEIKFKNQSEAFYNPVQEFNRDLR